jgi:hypothetical protein
MNAIVNIFFANETKGYTLGKNDENYYKDIKIGEINLLLLLGKRFIETKT